MSEQIQTNPNNENNHHIILPTAPGSNPSSFPTFDVAIDPEIELPSEERQGGDYIDLPGGGHVAPNGAVINNPNSEVPEVRPDHEYTPEKEDLNLMIM